MSKGTLGRVYGGDPTLIHIPDGRRANVGKELADVLDFKMRNGAMNRTDLERATQRLCPGCYMVAGFDMLVILAQDNGQDVQELARCMIRAFQKLAEKGAYLTTEEIEVILDPEECPINTGDNYDTQGL